MCTMWVRLVTTKCCLLFIPEQEELLREMTERAGKPTPEVYLLQNELEKIRNEVKQERAVFDHQRHSSERRLQEEVMIEADVQNLCHPCDWYKLHELSSGKIISVLLIKVTNLSNMLLGG